MIDINMDEGLLDAEAAMARNSSTSCMDEPDVNQACR